MPRLKSHKTVEQIAKKHRLDVSFIQKQLDMGEPIEHEHTRDHDLARDIALQHLDEIPDYYTRLKKMEADAKKHHKKFKDVKEATDGIKAKDYKGRLDRWFDDGGWVQTGGKYDGKPCAKQPGQTTKPYCRDPDDRASMDKEERNKRAAKKSREDPNPNESGKAKMVTQEAAGEKDACYHKVKSRYKKWPSAYASGALVKCRNIGADNWGTKSEETMHEEERYCPLCDKRETRSECSYGEKAWDKVSVKDEEYSMARSELKTIEDAVKRLKAKVGKGEGDLEAWVQSKITKAADYIDTAADYIASGEMDEELSSKINPNKHTSQKLSSAQKKIGDMTTAQQSQLPSKAKKVVGTSLPKFEETLVDKITKEILDEKCWPGYKRKKGATEFAKGSCVKVENVSIEDANGNTFAEVIDLIKPEPIKGFKSQVSEATRLQAQTGNVIAVTLSWRGKYYSLKMFFPQVKTPTRNEINDELQKVYPGSTVLYHTISEIHPGQPLIQAFGPQGGSTAKPGSSISYVKPMGEEVEIDEDWQSANRKDGVDGLSQSTVNKYRKENPGSKLQTAVTEKNPTGKRSDRRKSFCRRMSGMKSKLTSAKTSRDPDSRINKALRRWNCN
jgi:hypothetical protein